MKKHSERLGSDTIGTLLLRLSVPAMIGMIVMALYNIVDAIFLGWAVGPKGIAGIAIVFPVQIISMAIAQAIGIGGSSIISRSLGASDRERAERTLANMITLVVLIAGVISILGSVFIKPILHLFGAGDTLYPYASAYYAVIVQGLVLWFFAMSGNNVARAEGNAKIAMFSMMFSAVLNIVLDYFLIIRLDMGVHGAALATVSAWGFAALFLFRYFFSGQSALRIRARHLPIVPGLVKEIFAVGASAFSRQAAGSLMVIVINNALGSYGGDIFIAVFGVIFRLLSLAFMPMLGIVQGVLPIAGFNYGAHKYGRVLEALKLSIITTTSMGILAFSIFLVFSEPLLRLFGDDAGLITYGVPAIRIVVLAFPLVGFQMITAGLYQALGKPIPSFVLSLLRQVVFLLPLALILPNFFKLQGIWMAFPLADLLASVVTVFFLWQAVHYLNREAVPDTIR